jgi:phosphopantetheine adenylyltransferase
MRTTARVVVPIVLADDGERISSTRIAGGEIDAKGGTSVE